jgi:hypothetical protein
MVKKAPTSSRVKKRIRDEREKPDRRTLGGYKGQHID